jgi:hypothetical protein
MPALKNAKHEAFCNYIVEGYSQINAYMKAGYSENHAGRNGGALYKKAAIQARIVELREDRSERVKFQVQEYRDAAEKGITDLAELGCDIPNLLVDARELLEIAKNERNPGHGIKCLEFICKLGGIVPKQKGGRPPGTRAGTEEEPKQSLEIGELNINLDRVVGEALKKVPDPTIDLDAEEVKDDDDGAPDDVDI